jgi:hypothetical protein
MRTRAALCHYYPGYTLASLRTLRLREFSSLIEYMNQAEGGGDASQDEDLG